MKKFLTVLLALSVVFTYSFSAVGTAFAAEPTDTEAKLLSEAKAYAETLVASNFDTAFKTATAKNLQYTTITVDKEDAWDAAKVKAALQEFIDEQYVAAAKNYDNYISAASKEVLAGMLFTTDTNAAISEYSPAGQPAIASAQIAEVIFDLCEKEVTLAAFAADREAALSAFEKVDYSVYSDTAVDKTTGKTYLALAKDKVAAGKEAVSKMGVYDPETYSGNLNSLDQDMADIMGSTAGVTKYLTEKTIDVNGSPVGLGIYTVNGDLTKTDLENAGITDAATAAQIKATAQKLYADYVVTTGADKDFAEAYVKVVSYLADAGEIKTLATTSLSDPVFTPAVKQLYKDAVKNVEDLTTFAAKYKAEKDADGNLVRDGEAVDKLVEDYTVAEYSYAAGLTNNQPSKSAAQSAIVNETIKASEEGLAFHKEVTKKLLVDTKDSVIDDYYALEAAKIQANYDNLLAKIESADTIVKVHTIKADINNGALTAGIANADTVDASVSFAAGAAKSAKDAVNAYITYANSGKTVLDAGYIKVTPAEIEAQICKVYGEAGARKPSEMKAITIDPASIVAELPTIGGIATAKADAENAIKALPKTVTVADKDAVISAADLADAYATITKAAYGTAAAPENQSKLNTAINQLYANMQFDFAKKIAAVDKNDKAALRALQAELDDANELVGVNELFGNVGEFDASGVIANAILKIRDKELAAVKAAINAIPVNVTEADKAVVEAARKAYDAFVEDWTAYNDCAATGTDDYYAAGAVTNYRELALAEATLGLNEDPGKEVEALKITASSTAKKGSITVKWTVKGCNRYR